MRTDLLALTIDSLVLLSNVGLVKRAQKDGDAGTGPDLREEPDGTVTATSRDGATTRLPRDTPLKATQCSCGSSTVCRHRVSAVLAYQRAHAGAAIASESAVGSEWNPGEISDEALALGCGALSVNQARAAMRGSLLVTVRPGAIPVAALPSVTVQFLVPNDLAFAKCDCEKGHACSHLVLAVWAFRRLPAGGVLELGTPVDDEATAVLARLQTELVSILGRGLTELGSSRAIAIARASADSAGLVWVADALEDLERQCDAYERGSAAYRARTCSLLIAEIAARLRAASAGSDLPRRWILGSGEPRETQMDQVRLTPLGVRLSADGQRRWAELFFAERDTKVVLVLRKEWLFDANEAPKNGAELGEMYASSRMSLNSLARGELVTRAARRRANGEIDLSTARGMKSSMLPGAIAFEDLPSPILISDLAEHAVAERRAPPRFLGPRRIGREVHVLRVGRVVDLAYDRGEQSLVAFLEDPQGTRFLATTHHRAVSPGAIDATYRALELGPKFIAGELERARSSWSVSPLAILGERLVIPDIEKPRPTEMRSGALRADDELGVIIAELGELVDRGVQKGVSTVRPQLDPLSERLRSIGMQRLAALVEGARTENGLLDLTIARALVDEARPDT